MPTRAVTIMCLVQVGLLVLAWMLTSKFVRIAERTWEADGYFWGFETPMFQWLRGYRGWGLWLLAVPVTVALLCTLLSKNHRDIAIVSEGGFRLGVFVTILAVVFTVFVIWVSAQYAFGGRVYSHHG